MKLGILCFCLASKYRTTLNHHWFYQINEILHSNYSLQHNSHSFKGNTRSVPPWGHVEFWQPSHSRNTTKSQLLADLQAQQQAEFNNFVLRIEVEASSKQQQLESRIKVLKLQGLVVQEKQRANSVRNACNAEHSTSIKWPQMKSRLFVATLLDWSNVPQKSVSVLSVMRVNVLIMKMKS